jgi:hypothetical protein
VDQILSLSEEADDVLTEYLAQSPSSLIYLFMANQEEITVLLRDQLLQSDGELAAFKKQMTPLATREM